MSATWARVADWLGRCLPHRAAVVAQGWLPSQAIVQAMNFHPFDGVTGFASGNGVQTARKFDSAGRMTAISVSGVLDETLGYGTGPRIRTLAEKAGGGLVKTSFDYRAFGALRVPATDAPASAPAVATMVERDTRGRTVFDGRWHYTWTADGQVDTVADGQGRTVARYRYNADGERVSKTITGPTPRTTYFLWQAGRLVAEVEGSGEHHGEVTAQYFYVTEGPRTIPVAKLESAHAVGNTTGARRLLFVHADYRGQPEAMTDEHRQVVWRAHPDTWGFVQPSEVAHAQAVMNLRLPGQYFDEETGLHDNLNRSYDARPGSPLRGRYLSPDPTGYPDGPDAYAYVGGDPVNHADPLGLYQIDMHYYMTFFLAIAAGVPPDIARTIAEATQYVDDNPLTKPVEEDQNGNVELYESITTNQTRLEYYHFMADTLTNGAGIHDIVPGNQLMNLFKAASSASHPDETKCTQQVFFGEALHALGDSYAHQNNHDVPYNGVNLMGLGVGHGLDDSDPDYTFNHWGYPVVIDKVFPSAQPNASVPWAVHWGTNMDRTLAAEQAIYTQLASSPWAVAGNAVPFGSLATVMADFNSTGESEEFSYTWDAAGTQNRTKNTKVDHGVRGTINDAFTKKFDILDNALATDLGHPEIKVTSADWGYNQQLGQTNRSAQLGNLKCADYPGVILPAGTCPMP